MRMSTTIAGIESAIADFLSNFGIKDPEVRLEKPSDFKRGGMMSSVALKYAKEAGKNPYEFAESICSHVRALKFANLGHIEAARPGFINISFSPSFFGEALADIVAARADFGRNNFLKGQIWVVEHTSPNPNKAMHLGHLRNNLIGMSLVRLLSWSGAAVTSDAVDNNRGIAIAKLMWGFLEHMRKSPTTPIDIGYWASNQDQWYTPEEKGVLPDIFVTHCYVSGESSFEKDKHTEERVRDLVVLWEQGDSDVRKLWSHVLSYAYEGMERTLSRLGNHWDKVWHEHEHYQRGKRYVEEGLEKGIFKKLEDGAVLTDLVRYGLPDTILLKKDGTSLYITQDIALTALKKSHYGADKLVWVIGPEQSLAMKQLFAVCEQLGIGALRDFTHVAYGYVGLKDKDGGFKKMSSRAGTVVLIDDVIDDVKNKIMERLAAEHDGAGSANLRNLSEKMALAAVKFSVLKPDRTQDIVFDAEQSIETAGDSGIYVLYTYVRTQSILRKKQRTGTSWNEQTIGHEGDVLRQLLYFPEAVKRAREDFSVHHIAHYLLDICSAFNSWYGKEVVLDGSEREDYKLAITESVGSTIRNGLSILGIETVEKI